MIKFHLMCLFSQEKLIEWKPDVSCIRKDIHQCLFSQEKLIEWKLLYLQDA